MCPLGVEAVWNDHNYFVNVQPRELYVPVHARVRCAVCIGSFNDAFVPQNMNFDLEDFRGCVCARGRSTFPSHWCAVSQMGERLL